MRTPQSAGRLPALWQRKGIGVHWEDFSKEGHYPKTGESLETGRRRLTVDYELPMKGEYGRLVEGLVTGGGGKS